MIEQLVKFETSKLAKEKGFNIITGSNCWVETLDKRIIHNSERNKTNPLEDRCTDFYLAQPTQSLLQKWLREECRILVTSVYVGDSCWATWIHTIEPKSQKRVDIDTSKIDYSISYEQALEKGLIEALKLI